MSPTHLSTPYTAEDVRRLVEAATAVRGCLACIGCAGVLADVLTPFQPDPDAEVIEAMAWKFCETVCGTTHTIQEVAGGMRAAIAVYRAHQNGATS